MGPNPGAGPRWGPTFAMLPAMATKKVGGWGEGAQRPQTENRFVSCRVCVCVCVRARGGQCLVNLQGKSCLCDFPLPFWPDGSFPFPFCLDGSFPLPFKIDFPLFFEISVNVCELRGSL